MSRFKEGVVPWARGGFLAVALLAAGPLNGASVLGLFEATEAFDVYISSSTDELGSLQTLTANGDTRILEADLAEGATQYVHVVFPETSETDPAFIGHLAMNDFSFLVPDSAYAVTTDSIHWTARVGGLDAPEEAIIDLGPNGTDPWGARTGLPSDARYIWAGAGTGGRTFSIRIESTSPTSVFSAQLSLGQEHVFARSRDPVSRAMVGSDAEVVVETNPGVAGVVTGIVGSDGAGFQSSSGSGGFAAYDFLVQSAAAATTVDLSLNLRLKGLLAGGAGAGDLAMEESYASAFLAVAVFIGADRAFDSSVQIRADHLVGTGNDRSEITTNPREGFENLLPNDLTGEVGDYVLEFSVPIDEVIRTNTVTVEVGVPFTVWVNLSVSSLANIQNGRAVAFADFEDGFGFPTSGDVFNLPEGFTVESKAMSVGDNHFPAKEPPRPFTEGLFLKVGEIEGESAADGYQKWIDIIDFGSRVSRSTSLSRRVSPTHGDLVVMKHTDASSPKLVEGLTKGIVFPEAILVANLPELNGSRAVFEYRLKQAAVTEFHLEGAGAEPEPLETVSLDYERVDWIHRRIAADGSTSGEIVAWWDVATGTGGSTTSTGDNTPPVIETIGNQPVGSGEEGSVELTVNDDETALGELEITMTTDRPDLISELRLETTPDGPKIVYTTSVLFSGFATVNVTVSDGTDSRSISIPILIDVEMTPYEGYLAAYFSEDESYDPYLTAPLLDPDGDGLATQLEFLLGTNPREFNAANEVMTLKPDPESNGQALVVNFRRRVDEPNVQGFFWGSADTENWTIYDSSNPSYQESVKAGENPLYEDVTATITLPDGSPPLFLRYQSVGVF